MIKGAILNALILYKKFLGKRMKNSKWNSLDQSLSQTEITKCDWTSEIYPFLKDLFPNSIYHLGTCFVWCKKERKLILVRYSSNACGYKPSMCPGRKKKKKMCPGPCLEEYQSKNWRF